MANGSADVTSAGGHSRSAGRRPENSRQSAKIGTTRQLVPTSSAVFEILGPKAYWGHDLGLSGLCVVIGHVTIRFGFRDIQWRM